MIIDIFEIFAYVIVANFSKIVKFVKFNLMIAKINVLKVAGREPAEIELKEQETVRYTLNVDIVACRKSRS